MVEKRLVLERIHRFVGGGENGREETSIREDSQVSGGRGRWSLGD